MENSDLNSRLKEANNIGIEAKSLFKNGSLEEALMLKHKELALLEEMYHNTPKKTRRMAR